MTRDEISRFLDRRLDAWQRLDVAALTADHAVDGTVQSPTAGTITSQGAIEAVYRRWFDAFPDLKVNHEDVLIDDHRVAVFFGMSGTHRGDFMGIAGTGRRFDFKGVFLYDLADGHIKRDRRVYDFTGLLVQLGVLKARPA